MKRFTIGIATIVAVGSPALGSEHQMKVGEVLLSNGISGAASQYIELEDPGEMFPSTPYELVIYDAAGAQVGDPISLPLTDGETRFWVATDQAVSDFAPAVRDAELTEVLPNPGQACFQENTTKIHCLSWGTVTPVTGSFGTDAGDPPGTGMSLQRSGGAYVVDTPTPNAANVQPMTVDAPMVDAPGPMPDAPGGNPNNPMDDDGGCCGVGAKPGSSVVLALVALGMIVRSRRGRARP